jgi:hypothetical protein
MKRCPTCNRTYTDLSLNFCLEDGTPLTSDSPGVDPNATIRYPSARDTAEPPPTEIYRPAAAPPPPRPAPPPPQQHQPQPQQWSPTPTQPPRKKSNAVWWILGGLAALLVIGVGLVVMIIALASLSTESNRNLNANANANRNGNVSANVNSNSPNANASTPSGPFVDDFSEKKWNVGTSAFGRMWYDNGEYHMSSKPQTFIVMYAPSDDYSTENATVKVTARSVDGSVPSDGFGLLVHGGSSKTKKIEDYVLLIYPGEQPQYQIVMHKDGAQSELVPRTTSNAIHSGSSPNQLEVRIKGLELSFYANGQYLTKITDSANYRKGRAGFYTSDATDVAFDNLEIDR